MKFAHPRCRGQTEGPALSGCAQSVLEVRAFKLSIQKRRQEASPKDLRSWVATGLTKETRGLPHSFADGVMRSTQSARLNATLEPNALHIGPPPEDDEKSDWADLRSKGSRSTEEQNLANQIAATRIWAINRKTGDVSYTLNGRVSVIDRGRLVTVLNQDEAAIVFGLEMAVQKYGSRIACTGSEKWKRMVTWCAIKHGIFAQFTDPEMQGVFYQEQLFANPLQLRTVRLHFIETRLRTEETQDLVFTDEADARLLLSCFQPAAQSENLSNLESIATTRAEGERRRNLTIALLRSPTGQQSFKYRFTRGSGKRSSNWSFKPARWHIG